MHFSRIGGCRTFDFLYEAAARIPLQKERNLLGGRPQKQSKSERTLTDGGIYHQQSEQHGDKTRQTQLPVGERLDLPQRSFDSGGGKKPRNPLNDQNHSQDRHQKTHLTPPRSDPNNYPWQRCCGDVRARKRAILEPWGRAVKQKGRKDVVLRDINDVRLGLCPLLLPLNREETGDGQTSVLG